MRRLAVVLAGALLVGALVAASTRAEEPMSARAMRARTLEADAAAPFHATRLAREATTFRGGPIVDVDGRDRRRPRLGRAACRDGHAGRLGRVPRGAHPWPGAVPADDVRRHVRRGAGRSAARRRSAATHGISSSCPVRRRSTRRPKRSCGTSTATTSRITGSNAPWDAIDWGPKRWASAANVCARVTRKEAYPGDEGSNYARNPGEAWAEVYRLTDERKAGITTATWPIIAPSFYPGRSPRSTRPSSTSCSHGRRRARPRSRASSARRPPRSGGYRSRLRSTAMSGSAPTVPGRGIVDVALVASNRRTIVRRAQWVSQRVKRLEGSICGQRSLFVRVTETGLQGRVRVSVTTA